MKPSMRERMLAVIRGREHDRVPFIQYDGLAAPNEEIWSVIGRNNMGVIRWSGVHRFEHPNCRFETQDIERDGRKGHRTTMITPVGRLFEERFFEPAFGTSSISRHYVQNPEDYRVFMSYLDDIIVREDFDWFLKDWRELGDDGIPMISVGRTPYQQLWIQWVSLQDLSLHLVDCPDLVEECIALLEKIQRNIFSIVRKALDEIPIPFVNISDNITAPTIGERNFRKYCVPLYDELADMLDEKDIPVVIHMDGDLKPLWGAIGSSRIRGLDSFSPPPDNDTSASQAVDMWPDKMLMLNFPSSVHLAPPDEIYGMTARILSEAGHSGRLWIQISENVPPGVWKKSFPQIARAIEDFGVPGAWK